MNDEHRRLGLGLRDEIEPRSLAVIGGRRVREEDLLEEAVQLARSNALFVARRDGVDGGEERVDACSFCQ